MEASLGVFRGKDGRVPHRAEPALEALAHVGLRAPNDDLVGAIRLALMHRSYLYENQDPLPGIDPKHLDALALLGSAFQRRSTAIDAYRRYGDSDNGQLNIECNRVGSMFPSWATQSDWLLQSALLGMGYTPEWAPRKVATSLFNQLLGLLCLAGETAAAEGLLADLLAKAHDNQEIGDPRTTLQQILPDGSTHFEFSRTGPDHAASHRAIVTDSTGRQGTGEDTNKGAAAQAAALDFIQTHCMHLLLSTKPPICERRTPAPIRTVTAHFDQVLRIQELFQLPSWALGFLSQGLMHKSWTYENQQTVHDCGQQDNEVLAFLGSQTLAYEYFLAVSRATIDDSQVDDQGIATPRSSTYAQAFPLTGCAPGLLLGVGQARTKVLSTELAANAFQALFAAVLIGREFPTSLEESWPETLRPVWELIAPTRSRPEGPNTRLDALASIMRLSMRHRIDSIGPDHARRFRCTADLDSAATGRLTTIDGSFEQSKTEARSRTAEPFLRLIDALADEAPELNTDLAHLPVQFLVSHQATVFATEPALYEVWAQKRLFGLHLSHSPASLLIWAGAVDRLVGNDIRPCQVEDLASAFAETITRNSTADSTDHIDDVRQLDRFRVPRVGPISRAVQAALATVTNCGPATAEPWVSPMDKDAFRTPYQRGEDDQGKGQRDVSLTSAPYPEGDLPDRADGGTPESSAIRRSTGEATLRQATPPPTGRKPQSSKVYRAAQRETAGLVLTRTPGEKIMLGDEVVITVLQIVGNKVRLGIKAPESLPVYREEVWSEIHEQVDPPDLIDP